MPWLITGCVLLGLVFLLSLKVRVTLQQKDGLFTARVAVLWFSLYVYPKRQSKRRVRKTKAHREPPKKMDSFEQLKPVLENLQALLLLLREVMGGLYRKLCKKVVISKLALTADLSGEDAYHTALLYGTVSSGFFSFLALCNEIFTIENQEVHLTPVFDGPCRPIRLHFQMYLRIGSLLALAAKLLMLMMNHKDVLTKFIKGGA